MGMTTQFNSHEHVEEDKATLDIAESYPAFIGCSSIVWLVRCDKGRSEFDFGVFHLFPRTRL